MIRRVSLIATFFLFAPVVLAGDLVILADTVHTAGPRGVLRDAAILLRDGRISRISSREDLRLPEDIEVLRAEVVTPGLVDARTTVGLSGALNIPADQDHDETTGASQAQLRAIDSYNPREAMLDTVRRYGVTTIHATPGDANLIAGQGAILKTAGDTVAEAVLKPVASMLFNLGEEPKSAYAADRKAPATRMASAAIIRQALLDARHYARHGSDDGKTDLALAALADVVESRLPALFTAHREDDIATALRIAQEFELKAWIQYATEGYLMRRQLREAGVPIILGPTMQRLDGIQTLNASLENAALLHSAGVPIAFSTGHEDYVPKTRILLFEMTVAVANGLPAVDAIEAATINPARLLGVDERVGSLEPGKDADLVLFDGDPFEYTSHVRAVIIDGNIVHRLQADQ